MDSSSPDPPKPRQMRFIPRLPQAIVPKSNTEAVAQEENENAVRRIDNSGNAYDPIVLPLRNPNLVVIEEFGEVAKLTDYDEKTINSAKELGLTPEQEQDQDQHCKNQMLLLPLPVRLPVANQSTGENTNQPMGKMLVYKSGAVKWKLGEVLFDVSPGSKEQPANDVVVIDTEGKNCVRLGSNAKLAVVTPDVESLLKSDSDEETNK